MLSSIPMDLAGSVAVITGGARGIGRVIAASLASRGARVVVGDILEEGLDESVRMIRDAGGEAIGIRADVTRDDDVARLMDAAVERYGAINIVCANAGIIRDGLMLTPDFQTGSIARVLSSEDLRAVLEVNLVGAFITLREGARRMAANHWKGVLIVISSVHKCGQPGQLAYATSKAAVALWPKILAGELHSCGIRDIRVVAIAPGFTGTDAVKALDPAVLEGLLKDVHTARLVEPEEIAATIRHVVENEAIDATTIELTGGLTYGPWQRAR